MSRPLVAAAGYLAGIIVCFGPATVESEHARAAHIANCAEMVKAAGVCELGAPRVGEGLFKAMYWPLWLSYQAAKMLSGK